MLSEVSAVATAAPAVPVAPRAPAPEYLQLGLARALAARRFDAVQQLCPGWRGCAHHQRVVGRAFAASLALSLVGPGPRVYLNVAATLVPGWS